MLQLRDVGDKKIYKNPAAPCPFCGNPPGLSKKIWRERGQAYELSPEYHYGVHCINPGCPAGMDDGQAVCKYENIETAINEWNERYTTFYQDQYASLSPDVELEFKLGLMESVSFVLEGITSFHDQLTEPQQHEWYKLLDNLRNDSKYSEYAEIMDDYMEKLSKLEQDYYDKINEAENI